MAPGYRGAIMGAVCLKLRGGGIFLSRACVFDVNETLLDLAALDPRFERLFGDAAARVRWFDQFQQSWLVAMVTGGSTKTSGPSAARRSGWSPNARA